VGTFMHVDLTNDKTDCVTFDVC